jgi:hypothetical protein
MVGSISWKKRFLWARIFPVIFIKAETHGFSPPGEF